MKWQVRKAMRWPILRSRTDHWWGGRAAVQVLEMENFLTMVSALTSWASQPGCKEPFNLRNALFLQADFELIIHDSWGTIASLLSSPVPGGYLRSRQWALDATGEVKWQSAQKRSARGQVALQPALRSHWGSVCSLKVFQNVSRCTSEWERNIGDLGVSWSTEGRHISPLTETQQKQRL